MPFKIIYEQNTIYSLFLKVYITINIWLGGVGRGYTVQKHTCKANQKAIKNRSQQPLGYRCLSYSRSCLKAWELLEILGLGLLLFILSRNSESSWMWKVNTYATLSSLLSHPNNYMRCSIGSDQPHIIPITFLTMQPYPVLKEKKKKRKEMEMY